MKIIYTKPFLYFSFFLIATFLLMFFHARGWSSYLESWIAQSPRPVVHVFSGIGRGVSGFFGYFSQISRLNATHAQLKEQVRKLQEQNLVLQQHKAENEILKKQLNYRHTSKLTLIPASVIARDPTGLSQTITIDAGANDGIKAGNAVVSQGVMVGKIIAAEAQISKVLLITDPQSSIDAGVSSGGYSGILRGSFGSGLVLDMVAQNFKITSGDLIMTAGLTNPIPRGILIGAVGELQSQKNDLLQKATVISSVDLKNLIFLDVVKSAN